MPNCNSTYTTCDFEINEYNKDKFIPINTETRSVTIVWKPTNPSIKTMDNNGRVFAREKTLKVEVIGGMDIYVAIAEAINLSKSTGFTVVFEFDEIELEVNPYSTVGTVCGVWNYKRKQARIEYENSPEYAAMHQGTEMSR